MECPFFDREQHDDYSDGYFSPQSYTFETHSTRKLEGKLEDIGNLEREKQALMQKREVNLAKRMEEMERRHQQQLQDLAAKIDEQNAAIAALQSEKNDLSARHECSSSILKVVREHMSGGKDLFCSGK